MSATNSAYTGYSHGENESSLLAALRVIRDRWWLVAGPAVACLLIALALSKSSTKQYTAMATLLVRTSDLAALVDPTQVQTVDPARQTADTLLLLRSGAVAARVKSVLHLPDPIAALQGRVDATEAPNTDLVGISITDPSPARAAELANGFATALVQYRAQSDQAQVAAGQAQITEQLRNLTPADSSARSVLRQALKQVVALRAVTNGNVQVVDPAQTPSSPSSPNVKQDLALGALIGFVLGLALAFLFDAFDRRIKSVEEFEELYGLPALTSIPMRKRRPVGDHAAQADLEPFRILRDGLIYSTVRDESRVILVTSAVPAEGKTRVAAGLARAMAVADRKVVLVEADLHRPALRRELTFRPQNGGLIEALANGRRPAELLSSVPDVPRLSVLPSGTHAQNSAELLQSAAMASLLGELADDFEFVVLDAPPLLPVADAQALLDNPMIDVCLIVGRPYLTTRQQVRQARSILERHTELGFALAINAVKDTTSGYYYLDGGSKENRRERRQREQLASSSKST